MVINQVLTRFKPKENDVSGHVYILQRSKDIKKFKQGKITHILLHKVGLST
jgi:hypothetical protein